MVMVGGGVIGLSTDGRLEAALSMADVPAAELAVLVTPLVRDGVLAEEISVYSCAIGAEL